MADTFLEDQEKSDARSVVLGPRPDEGPMDDDEFQAIAESIITDAARYVDNELSPARAKVTDYYKGRPFGNEEPGRSQVVLTEVRDGIIATLPSMMRVYFGSEAEQAVEFIPSNPTKTAEAAQATAYANYVFRQDNNGFLETFSVFKDGLTKAIGAFKWWWDDTSEAEQYKLEGLTEQDLLALQSDPNVTLTRITPDEDGAPPADPNQPPADPSQPAPQYFDVELSYRREDGRLRIMSVPPEELIFDREARDIDSALFVGHRTKKTRGELIAMGIDEEKLEQFASSSNTLDTNPENISRQPNSMVQTDQSADESNDKILYVEGYAHIDFDGDGIAELRNICTIGDAFEVVHNEPANERPFAVFCPDPEPHTLVGGSWADRLMDLQKSKSSVFRCLLDSLALAIFPRQGYVEGQVSVADIMNTEIGAPIRMTNPQALVPITTQFVGKEAFPVLDYFDTIKEQRTGQNKGATGLDADALQSSTKEAVTAAVTASQAQLELLARIFAETCLKRVFKGVLKMLVQHQPSARMVRLRNQWVHVDPRVWDADMDVRVNVALGTGLVEKKTQVYLGIVSKQEYILSTLGLSNPIVSLHQYSYALGRLTEMQGEPDATKFFSIVPPEWQPPPPPPGPPADPAAMAMVQVEQQKAQAQAQAKSVELQQKDAEAVLQHQREMERVNLELELKRQELQAEILLKERELDMKYGVQRESAHIDAETKRHSTIAGMVSKLATPPAPAASSGGSSAARATAAGATEAIQLDRLVKALDLPTKDNPAPAKKAPKRVRLTRDAATNQIDGFEIHD